MIFSLPQVNNLTFYCNYPLRLCTCLQIPPYNELQFNKIGWSYVNIIFLSLATDLLLKSAIGLGDSKTYIYFDINYFIAAVLYDLSLSLATWCTLSLWQVFFYCPLIIVFSYLIKYPILWYCHHNISQLECAFSVMYKTFPPHQALCIWAKSTWNLFKSEQSGNCLHGLWKNTYISCHSCFSKGQICGVHNKNLFCLQIHSP